MRSFPWMVLALGLGACGFSASSSVPSDGSGAPADSDPPGDGLAIDARPPIDAPPPIDASVCFGAGFGAVCLAAAPTQPVTLAAGTFDTGGAACTEVVSVNAVELCVVAGTTVTLPAGTTVRATGSRPLVLVATSTMSIDGDLDARARIGGLAGPGSGGAACGTPATGENDVGGAGGGAGGSYGSAGGGGGPGDANQSAGNDGTSNGGTAQPGAAPTTVRAGCPGAAGGASNTAGGAGGAAGGAVYLIAGASISITGRVLASGAGGSPGLAASGGGGGGAGGLIGLDAPIVTVTPTGVLAANGGGGGEGGGNMSGDPGADGTIDATRATGGANNSNGGDGGLGSGGGVVTGSAGGTADGGGGGGGGGAGYVYVMGAISSTGLISPAASVVP